MCEREPFVGLSRAVRRFKSPLPPVPSFLPLEFLVYFIHAVAFDVTRLSMEFCFLVRFWAKAMDTAPFYLVWCRV